MVQTNLAQASKKLEAITRENLHRAAGKPVYSGHQAEYSPAVHAVRNRVRTRPPKPGELLKRKAHWHPDFGVDLADDLEAHNYKMAIHIYSRLAEHTQAGRPVVWITPVGPMGQYAVIAELMNKLGGVNARRVHTFAMDEWSTRDGKNVSKKEYPYMTQFAGDMEEQFFSLLRGKARVPKGNRHFAADDGLTRYEADIDALLKEGAGVIFTGGVGKIGHIMFWESTYGVRLGRALAEKVMWIRGAPLTYGTIDQNETTSSASAPVPAFANSIGLGLFVKFQKYDKENPGRAHAYFGLDNNEEPLKWQRFIAQCMLLMDRPDPSFGASYVPTLPGAYIIVRSHVEQSFFVASK
jgi:glucosamine-6-phosphate deaminase